MKIYSVLEISADIKSILESTMEYVQVRGEVVQPKRHQTGHAYFSLQQGQAVLDCVAWRSVKLGFELEHGMEIVCGGTITSYAGRSKYQMNVRTVESTGIGDLIRAIEERKKRLAAEGLFELNRLIPIPKFPQSLGIITSKTGAVIHDMLHRLKDRYPLPVTLYPIAVQGSDVGPNVAEAIKYFNSVKKVDIIILARGGGSFEDLIGFNEELVVRSIAASSIPVVSAIGHETDTTLADYAAALRAPTPTASIELITPNKSTLAAETARRLQYLRDSVLKRIASHELLLSKFIKLDLNRILSFSMQKADYAIADFHRSMKQYWSSRDLKVQIKLRKPDLSIYHAKIARNMDRIHKILALNSATSEQKILQAQQRLEDLSYKGTMSRGFCLASSGGTTIKTAIEAKKLGEIDLEFRDGSVRCRVGE